MTKKEQKDIRKVLKDRETIPIEELREKHPEIAAVVDGLSADKSLGFKVLGIYPPQKP